MSATAVDDGSYKLLVDGTLSVSGAAADAESVGKELGNLLEMLAEKTQLTPEFANDISECTDTKKLYVLPDGEIYAYRKHIGALYTNRANPSSEEWETDKRISTSSIVDQTGATISNLIPATSGVTIYIKNLNVYSKKVSGYPRFACYLNGERVSFVDGTTMYYGINNGYGTADEDNSLYSFQAVDMSTGEPFDFDFDAIRICGVIATGYTAEDVIITVNEEIVEGITYKWESTGLAFVPADYEDRIIVLEKKTEQINIDLASMESRIDKLEEGAVEDIPDYYTSHLEEKIDLINQVMETAGRNKSSSLIYTDAHVTAGNAWITPLILVYLYKNTALNKTIFAGDLLGDPTDLTHEYLKSIYAWRILIKFINQHSALGNHDNLHKGRNDSDIAKMVYAFLIAPEETPDMVMGDDFYYYIDDVCERTRYLYLDSGRYNLSDDETKFIIDALTSTKAGWHIVVVSHIWFQYTSVAAPTVGSINGYMQKALNLFDAYNSRETGSVTMMNTAYSYDFREAGGKVEFCVGGHIHVSYVVYSKGGIPVVLLPSDANQDRSSDHTDDCGTLGTITEVAVGALIADYDNGILTIVGIGRMQDRVIEL